MSKVDKIEYVVVRNLIELKRAVAPFESNGKPRETLMQGMDQIKTKFDAYLKDLEDLDESKDSMGGFVPAAPLNPMVHRYWVDDIIQKRLGGSRDGLNVKWSIVEGDYTWDPYTRELKQCLTS